MAADQPAQQPQPRLLLLGMMGAGKTTVGRAVTALAGWPYVDNDELVAQVGGRPTPELLQREGVAALRRVESAALTRGLELPGPVVVGVAGGVVLNPADRERLRGGGTVVWLRARIDTLAHRVGDGAGRPWLGDDPEGVLRALAAGREPFYADVAHLVLDVDETGPGELARRAVAAAQERVL